MAGFGAAADPPVFFSLLEDVLGVRLEAAAAPELAGCVEDPVPLELVEFLCGSARVRVAGRGVCLGGCGVRTGEDCGDVPGGVNGEDSARWPSAWSETEAAAAAAEYFGRARRAAH